MNTPTAFQNIPAELKELRQWVGWRTEMRRNKTTGEEKPTKVLKNPGTRSNADSTKPNTWGSLEEAVRAYESNRSPHFDGIGFVFSQADEYTGIDLDKCRDPQTGITESWALKIIKEIDSYTEVSPSGSGWHIITRSKLRGARRKKNHVEMYDCDRYFTITGNLIPDVGRSTIETRDLQSLEEQFQRGELGPPSAVGADKKSKQRDGTESGEDWRLLDELAREIGAKNADELEAALKRRHPERYAERNRVKGKHAGRTYWRYTIDRWFEKRACGSTERCSEEAGAGRESAATAIISLARSTAELFHFGEDSFATIKLSGHVETYSLRSRAFRSWLNQVFFREKRRAATGEALASAIGTLDGFARFECPERETFVRVAGTVKRMWIDLGDPQWRQVEIDSTGWHVVEASESPVRFRRAHGMQSLPAPQRGGSLNELRNFVNVGSDSDFRLLVGDLVGALRPCGPYPILVLYGEQGSAKSTTTRVLRSLIDPSVAPLRSDPRDARDLMIAAANGWMIPLDNISRLEPWLSDCLCRLSTGGGFSTRALYSDAEETIFQAQRPIILNGIEELAVRGDLLDRCIVLDLPRIDDVKRRDEHSFNAAFEAERARLFGALLDAVSAAIHNHDSAVIEDKPRMADFARWVTSAEPALGWKRGEFLTSYRNNRRGANELVLETPLAEAVRKVDLPWKGTATELLKMIGATVDEGVRRQKGWPSSARTLSNALRRLAPNLRQAGVLVEFADPFGKPLRQAGTGRRLISISENTCNSASQESHSRPAQSAQGISSADCDERDGGEHALSGLFCGSEEGDS